MGSHIKNKYLLYENIISIVVCGILFVETPIFDNTIEGRTPLLPITVIVLTLTDYLFIGIKNRSKFTWTIVDYFLVLCLLMLSLSYFCNKYYGINYLYYSYLYCFVIYFFFRRYFSNMKIASMHLKLISTLSFFVAMLVIYHFCFTGNLKGFFRNNNFVGMYLGVTFPFQIALYLYLLNNYKNKKYYLSYVLLAIYISIIAVIITLCRSAIISIFLSSWFIVISHMNVIKVNYKLKTLISKYNKIALLIIFIISCFVLYYIKPISSISRILIWRVVCNIILQHPITGVGIGKLSNIYNLYQGEYFNSSHSTILQIASGSAFHAFNVPLEIAAELGVVSPPVSWTRVSG